MRLATMLVVAVVAGLPVLAVAPIARDVPDAQAKPGKPIVLDPFPGPFAAGAYLAYSGAHSLADHCPYAYILRVESAQQIDLSELWALWLWFVDHPWTPPSGFAIEWQGFPDLVFIEVSAGTQSFPPPAPFEGVATEGSFQWSAMLGAYGFRPADDSISAGTHGIRPHQPGDPFIVNASMCL